MSVSPSSAAWAAGRGLLLRVALLLACSHPNVVRPLAQMRAPPTYAFILPLFTLSVLLLGLQGYAAGLEDLHMLAPLLALAFALCCRHSALALALIILGVAGVLAQGAIQASTEGAVAVGVVRQVRSLRAPRAQCAQRGVSAGSHLGGQKALGCYEVHNYRV